MDAFDADVLIFAAAPGHALGQRVRAIIDRNPAGAGDMVKMGSVLLLPEVLTKPRRVGNAGETSALLEILARLELREFDVATARLAVELGARHRLNTIDAAHLATAAIAGADRFITNNRKDFPQTIEEVAITYPDDLPLPGS